MIRIGGHERGVSYPQCADFTVISAWSRGKAPYKELSPFIIGPIIYNDDGIERRAMCFENMWQSHKVYTSVNGNKEFPWPQETHLVGEIVDDKYYEWANAIRELPVPIRRPNGNAIPKFALFGGERYGLFESRINIYIRYYQELLRGHIVYKQLLARFCRGENLLIVEPDGPSPRLFPGGILVNEEILSKLVFVDNYADLAAIISDDPDFCTNNDIDPNKYVPLGHGAVIAITLLEDRDEIL